MLLVVVGIFLDFHGLGKFQSFPPSKLCEATANFPSTLYLRGDDAVTHGEDGNGAVRLAAPDLHVRRRVGLDEAGSNQQVCQVLFG